MMVMMPNNLAQQLIALRTVAAADGATAAADAGADAAAACAAASAADGAAHDGGGGAMQPHSAEFPRAPPAALFVPCISASATVHAADRVPCAPQQTLAAADYPPASAAAAAAAAAAGPPAATLAAVIPPAIPAAGTMIIEHALQPVAPSSRPVMRSAFAGVLPDIELPPMAQPSTLEAAMRAAEEEHVRLVAAKLDGLVAELQGDWLPPKWWISPSELLDVAGGRAHLGAGAFAAVQLKRWRQQAVAVKWFSPAEGRARGLLGGGGGEEACDRKLRSFRGELQLLRQLRHPHVVACHGAVRDGLRVGIVLEYCPRQSLAQVLREVRAQRAQLTPRQRLQIARDLAAGLRYLHSRKPAVIHRDLSSNNVLLSGSLRGKLCDFGLSQRHVQQHPPHNMGTAAWMAPEVHRGDQARIIPKADIYSLGVLLWELATGQVPFEGYNPWQIQHQVAQGTLQLELPANLHPRLARLIRDCLHRCPCKRPSARSVQRRLGRLPGIWPSQLIQE